MSFFPFRSSPQLRVLAAAAALCWAPCASAADDPVTRPLPMADFDKLTGQPVDIAASAYAYRADRKAAENPPERSSSTPV